jgi:hypothetical protein
MGCSAGVAGFPAGMASCVARARRGWNGRCAAAGHAARRVPWPRPRPQGGWLGWGTWRGAQTDHGVRAGLDRAREQGAGRLGSPATADMPLTGSGLVGCALSPQPRRTGRGSRGWVGCWPRRQQATGHAQGRGGQLAGMSLPEPERTRHAAGGRARFSRERGARLAVWGLGYALASGEATAGGEPPCRASWPRRCAGLPDLAAQRRKREPRRVSPGGNESLGWGTESTAHRGRRTAQRGAAGRVRRGRERMGKGREGRGLTWNHRIRGDGRLWLLRRLWRGARHGYPCTRGERRVGTGRIWEWVVFLLASWACCVRGRLGRRIGRLWRVGLTSTVSHKAANGRGERLCDGGVGLYKKSERGR